MNKIFSTLIVIGLLVVGFGVYSPEPTEKSLGSVGQTGEYQSVTSYAKNGSALFSTYNTLVDNKCAVLGSVVITGAVAGPLRILNATSTTDSASTTIAMFPNSTAVGTYVFDSIVTRGLIVEATPGTIPTTTITYRSCY